MSIKKIGKFNFEGFRRKMPGIKRKVAVITSNQADEFFKASFDRQGFLDRGLQRWRPSRKERGKTLVDTGSLRRSIEPTRVSFKRSVIETVGIPYAAIHNDGGRAGRNRSTEIPKRRFMGNSAVLIKQMKKTYTRHFAKVV